MAEYLIQEESLIELADIIRRKYEYFDCNIQMISDRKNLTTITIPDNVTTIGDSAFWECENLTTVIIPNSVTTLSNQAFIYCSNLTTITIPNSVTSIGSGAFQGCRSLTDIYIHPVIPPKIGNYMAIPTITTIHVPIGSGDAYKNATNWSSYADKIVEDIVV